MTDSQENLKVIKANRKFWAYMVEEKDEILRDEIQKVEEARSKFREMFQKLKVAPEKLKETQRNEKHAQAQIEKELEIPASSRQEILNLVETMKMKLRKLGRNI